MQVTKWFTDNKGKNSNLQIDFKNFLSGKK